MCHPVQPHMYELETNLITRYISRPTALETITLADYAAFFDSSRTTQKQPTAEGLSGSNTEEETTHNPRSASPSAPKKRRTARVLRSARFNADKDPEKHAREQLMLKQQTSMVVLQPTLNTTSQ